MLPIGLVWVGLLLGAAVACSPKTAANTKDAILITAWLTGLVAGTITAGVQWISDMAEKWD